MLPNKAMVSAQDLGYRPSRQALEQYTTFFQSRSHFLRHVNGRLHRGQIFSGNGFRDIVIHPQAEACSHRRLAAARDAEGSTIGAGPASSQSG